MERHIGVVQLEENTKKNISSNLLKRNPNNHDSYVDTVQQIVDGMKERQDATVFEYMAEFDGVTFDASDVRVTETEVEEAMGLVEPPLLEVTKKSMRDIRDYRQKQMQYD